MKLCLICLFALSAVSLQAAEDLSKPIEVLRAVGKEVESFGGTCHAALNLR